MTPDLVTVIEGPLALWHHYNRLPASSKNPLYVPNRDAIILDVLKYVKTDNSVVSVLDQGKGASFHNIAVAHI